ncbi:MAG: Hsp20/alpha crystallin family protein [Candidatus Lokiarchaeia archaeon]
MNENQDKEQELELKEEVENSEQILETKKKQKEIAIKRDQASSFRTSDPETLEFKDNEPYYRNPLINIIENDELYYILVELPGLDKKNVTISLQDGILELIGEKTIKNKDKKEEKKEKEKKEKKDEKKDKDKKKEKIKEIKGDYLRREFWSTSFYRSFHLPEDIDPEGIDASFKNGILQLKIPKMTAKISDKQVIDIK